MTRATNARVAGWVFLLYIATGITSMVLGGRAFGGAPGTAEKLASIAQHASLMQVNVVLTLLQAVYALVLGVTLYALTRDQDHDLALLALTFRVAEGVINAVSVFRGLALLSVATTSASGAVVELLLSMGGWSGLVSATCFAVGSTIYCWLFLRARSIPVWLSSLGVVASVLLVALLPGQLVGVVRGAIVNFMWLPMLVFEVTLALWLLVKGVSSGRGAV